MPNKAAESWVNGDRCFIMITADFAIHGQRISVDLVAVKTNIKLSGDDGNRSLVCVMKNYPHQVLCQQYPDLKAFAVLYRSRQFRLMLTSAYIIYRHCLMWQLCYSLLIASLFIFLHAARKDKCENCQKPQTGQIH